MTLAPHPDWHRELPVLVGDHLRLREPVLADAPRLLREICAPDVCAYVPPAPATLEGMERTIGQSFEWRQLGRGFCFGVEPKGTRDVVGLIQFLSNRDRHVPPSLLQPWEWGFALGSNYWGTGLFREAASMALTFAFDTVGLTALEAWVLEENERANKVLARLGATATLKLNTKAPDGRTGNFVLWTSRQAPF